MAKILYEEINGSPVDFPTEAEILEMRLDINDVAERGNLLTDESWHVLDDEPDETVFQLMVPLRDDTGEVVEASPDFQCTAVVAYEASPAKHRPQVDDGSLVELSQEAKAFI